MKYKFINLPRHKINQLLLFSKQLLLEDIELLDFKELRKIKEYNKKYSFNEYRTRNLQ